MIASIKKQKEDMRKGKNQWVTQKHTKSPINNCNPNNTIDHDKKPGEFEKSLNSKDIKKEYNQV